VTVTITGDAVAVAVCDGIAVVEGVSDGGCPNAVGVNVGNPKIGVGVGVPGPTMVRVGTTGVLIGIRVGVRIIGVLVAGTGVVGFGIGVRVGTRVLVAVGGTWVNVDVGIGVLVGGSGVNVKVGGIGVLVGGSGVSVGGSGVGVSVSKIGSTMVSTTSNRSATWAGACWAEPDWPGDVSTTAITKINQARTMAGFFVIWIVSVRTGQRVQPGLRNREDQSSVSERRPARGKKCSFCAFSATTLQ
jgi:hypothetical protein